MSPPFSLLLLVCKTHAQIQLFFQREGVRRIISFSIGGSRPIFGNITMRILKKIDISSGGGGVGEVQQPPF